MRDQLNRPLRDLRLSVTDRCNLRCRYCMPEQDYIWLPRTDILSFEEIGRLVAAFGSLGVTKVRITGGEPLLRRGLAELVQRVGAQPSVRDLAITTNGVGLAARAQELRQAGLGRVTVSLDTLRPERFTALTQRANHADVLAGIAALAPAGFTGTKINMVVMRGFNDDELGDLLELGAQVGAEVRFIEYMDVGGATEWAPGQVVGVGEILHRLGARSGPIDRLAGRGSAPANRYRLPDGRVFGIVASTTEPFCATCDRSRVTADGLWYRCLYAQRGIDLRTPLRQGATADDLRSILTGGWRSRRDQGAVERQAQPERGSAVPVTLLRRDPHLEMHTRGG